MKGKVKYRIRGTVINPQDKQGLPGLRVELWDKDLFIDDRIDNVETDAEGRFESVFDEAAFREWFFDRSPDVYFKVFHEDKLLLNTLGSVICNLQPGVHEVVLEVEQSLEPPEPPEPPQPPEPPEPPQPPKPPLPTEQAISGRAVLSPEWEPGVLIEAFADENLEQPIGSAQTDANGQFAIPLTTPAPAIWFRWSQGEYQGRSPKLQPFSPDAAIRLHVYRPWRGPARGNQRYQAFVQSTSGRAVVGMPVSVLEVTLKRCQILGESLTNDNGTAVVFYDLSALFMDRPDLRVLVFDVYGTPLLESDTARAVLPGRLAQTKTQYLKVAEAFLEEGFSDLADLQLNAQDLHYMTERTGLSARSLATYAAASKLAGELSVPAEALFAIADSSAPNLEKALENAVEQDLVSTELLEEADKLIPVLDQAGKRYVTHKDLGRGSLDAFLATQVADAALREQVAGLVLEAQSWPELHAKLEQQQLSTPQLKLLLDVQSVVGVDVELAKAIARWFQNNQLHDGQDMALFSNANWEEILRESSSKWEDDAEALQALVAAVKQRAQKRFPEKVFHAVINRYAGQSDWARNIRDYFANHPDLNFNSPLPLPVTAGGNDVDLGHATQLAAYGAYQRVYRLTNDHTVVGDFLNSGIRSALDLAAMSAGEFKARFLNTFEGNTAALQHTHARAQQRTAALNYAASFLPVGRPTSLCACSHCKSIFGPAAYLFELLSLFGRYDTDEQYNGQSLLFHLKKQRPDCTRTHLSCPNTNIEVPQIDLVNEILEDLILAPRGTSVAHNLGEGECLPAERQTRGTSEERKATPQNLPSAELAGLLAETVFPWTLPYDYQRDRAGSARDRLISKPEDILLIVWRYAVAADAATQEEATRALGNSMLDLSEPWITLITKPLPLARAWGDEVADAVAKGGPELALLKQVATTDYVTLENVLDTAFVRGEHGEALRIEPEDFCKSGKAPYLSGPPDVLSEVLDRFHRFERLRRHLEWEVGELDQALQWLGGNLAERLYQLGILRFLQRRLGITPTELLTLFRVPDVAKPATLRNREVVSAFEAQFGSGASRFEIPEPASATREEEREQQKQFLAAQIAKVSGESPAAVDFVFNNGLVYSLNSIADILTLPPAEAQAACRRAVVAAWRLSLWSRRLRMDKSELLDLIGLSHLQLFLPESLAADPLADAVRLIDLADQQDSWPVTASELRYLLGTDPASQREHGLSASEVGADLMTLRQDIRKTQEATEPLPEDPRAALRTALLQLLTNTLPGETSLAEMDVLINDLAGDLEWSAFFAVRGDEAETFLTGALREWPGMASITLPDTSVHADKLENALNRIVDALSDWLIQNSAPPAPGTDSQFEALEQNLRAVILAELEAPRSGDIASLQSNLGAVIGAPSDDITDERLNRLTHQLIFDALSQMDTILGPQLTDRAAALLPLAANTWRHMQARNALGEWISARYAVSLAQAETILDQLSDPDTEGQPIIRAFVDEAGTVSERLNKSAVKATFLAFSDSSSSVREVLLEKNEHRLMFDWLAYPPNSALKDRPFTVELEVEVARAAFVNADGSAAALVLEADGAVDIEILVEGAAPLSWHEPSSDQVRQIALSADISSEIATLHIRYSTPETGGARVLRLYKKNTDDGLLDEWQWPVLMPLVQRLHRAALALRNVTLPSPIWTALKPAAGHVRNVDLDHLAGKAAIGDWFAYFALTNLFKRIQSRDVIPAFAIFLSGNAIPREDWVKLLNLDDSELDNVLLLLNVPDQNADTIALPADITLEQLKALLDLADQARRFNLSATAFARWNQADYDQIYEWSLSALRVGLEQQEWFAVLTEVHDPVRIHLRDAQLDFLVGQNNDLFPSREAVSDFLLTDTQMSPCMTTTRIQFAYAAVQRYVATAQAGRLPWLPRGKQEEHFAREWVSLRFYRLYEAEKRIEAHTENWIEPAIRPHKTPAFERLEQTMHSGPLNLHLAEKAMKEYVASLAEIAHLEPVAVVTHDEKDRIRPLAFRDSELFGTHVFARTRSHPRRLYYRRRLPLPDGRWLPWERIDAEMEGTHYLAVVVFGRLRLICSDFSVARPKRMDQCDSGNDVDRSKTTAGQTIMADYEVTLSWIEREYGKWSSIRRSKPLPFAFKVGKSVKTDIFNTALPNHFGVVKREGNSRLEAIEVQINFETEWTMDSGSSLKVNLLDEYGQNSYNLGIIKGSSDSIEWLKRSKTGDAEFRLPEDFDAESKAILRLEWDPNVRGDDITGYTDDCIVNNIKIRFYYDADGSSQVISHPQEREIKNGKMWPQPDSKSEKARKVSLPFNFWGGKTLDPTHKGKGNPRQPTDFFNAEEQAWKVFEGNFEKFSLDTISPFEAYFEIEVEFIPESVDFSSALSIQADVTGNDFFTLNLFSVPRKLDGRMRAHFKVKDEILETIPEIRNAWGSDWVSTDEFCFDYDTDTDRDSEILANLRIYSDDTIQSKSPLVGSMGIHEGTKSMGQELTSNSEEVLHPVYCDGYVVAKTHLSYKLTVERQFTYGGRLSSGLSPKILDQINHSASFLARTVFIDRQDEIQTLSQIPMDTKRLLISAEMVIDMEGGTSIQKRESSEKLLITKAQTQANTEFSFDPTISLPRGHDYSHDPLMDVTLERLADPNELLARLQSYKDKYHVWRFQTFWHPQAIGFRRVLESKGLPQLVRIENQMLSRGTDLVTERGRVDYFEQRFNPTLLVDPRWPRDEVDFTLTGACSEDNWEVFWDSLLYMAQRFDEEGQSDNAGQIFALLLDISRVAEPDAWMEPSLFQTAPIRLAVEQEIKGLPGLIDSDTGQLKEDIVAQIKRIRLNPYQPHLIARGWPVVYARALKIRYVEHLIQAGETDFRRAYASDNRSYLESASSRFDLAARILGPAEDTLPAIPEEEITCYEKLIFGQTDRSNNESEQLETYLPDDIFADGLMDDEITGQARLRFCIPPNDKLNELRALVADRLLKLRSCQDIEGVRQALSLYGQRIDPALLVRATAAGLDLDILLGRISSAKPTMYFQALWQRALQACERARSLEDTWLSAQERADSEEMAQLQNEQELRLLEEQEEVVSQRLEDARKLKEAMVRTIESAEIRFEFYSSRERMNMQEKAEGLKLAEAGKADGRAADDSRTASDSAWIPTIEIHGDVGTTATKPFYYANLGIRTSYRLGGETGVQVYRANAEGHRNAGSEARVEAGLMGRQGSFDRRKDDWKLQEKLAQIDKHKGELDLAGAEIRINIAELELDLHKQRLNDARTVRDFLRSKFTSKELHSWRASRLQRLRYDQHRIAYDLVMQAKAALVREHGLEDQGLITDTWDNTHKGIGAAAGLLHELEKLQQLYMETWRREQEKLKIYSLAERDPLAYLELLQRGEAIFTVTETDYDEDGAGDYFRRFRHISLDIPAVRGPYTNVNARLTQLRGEYRMRAHRPDDSAYYRDGAEDARFRDDLANGEFIVTNTAVQDDGRVSQQQDGEHPPPFGMNGAISTFRIELKPDINHFDRQTVTDVILRMTISSRIGGETAAKTGVDERKKRLANQPQPVMIPLHSTFSNAWHQFIHTLTKNSEADLVVNFEMSHIPLRLQPVSRIVQSNLYFAIPEGQSLENVNEIGLFSLPPDLQPAGDSSDPHLPPPIHRLKLNEPLVIGQERTFRFRKGGEAVPKKGWLICWVEGAGSQ